MSERESIISKIEKILRKADDASCTEEERETFYAKAADMMIRHQVEEAELRLAGDTTVTPEQRPFLYSTNDANLPGKRMLMAVACEITGCQFIYYRGSRHEQRGVIVGFPDDIEVTTQLYTSFYLQSRQQASMRGFTAKRLVTGYMQGFAVGIADKYADVRAVRESETPGTGLVLASREDEVKAEADKLGATPGSPEKLSDQYAAGVGQYDGGNADIGLSQVGGGPRQHKELA